MKSTSWKHQCWKDLSHLYSSNSEKPISTSLETRQILAVRLAGKGQKPIFWFIQPVTCCHWCGYIWIVIQRYECCFEKSIGWMQWIFAIKSSPQLQWKANWLRRCKIYFSKSGSQRSKLSERSNLEWIENHCSDHCARLQEPAVCKPILQFWCQFQSQDPKRHQKQLLLQSTQQKQSK